ncbi:MAG: NADH-quinone oxidoreductase subunit L [Planctomycetota bacterium]
MMEWIAHYLPARDVLESRMYLIPLFPLIGFLLNGLFGRKFDKKFSGFIGTLAALCAFIMAFMCVASLHEAENGRTAFHSSYGTWILTSELNCSFGLYIDKLSSVMILVVTGIGTLIHLYSMGYMAHDKSVWRFFAYLNLFLFAMILLVLGDNLLMTFVGWEGVGLCSYLLIGFWYEESKNAAAGMKAFVVNRIGDLGFLMGIFTLIAVFGTVNYVTAPVNGEKGNVTPQTTFDTVTKQVKMPENPGLLDYTEALRLKYGKGEKVELPEKAELPKYSAANVADPKDTVSIPLTMPKDLGKNLAALITLACICLFIGATGKSAQIPLFVWLPDAMAGPTPVSALIHAATMVTAGIYMVCRLHSLFAFSETALLLIAGVGAATALFSALIGLTQLDIKKVLAYSTVSQLGYMFVGLGAGVFSLGIFHVLTHAFFKALLFLGAGSVIHAMSNEQDMRKMGGLWKKLPWTFGTMLIGALALSGVPGTSGWFSKDNILANVLARYHDTHNVLYLVYYVMGITAALCTAFYTFRLIFLTFFGQNRSSEDVKSHIHESPWTMVLPLVVLAFFSLAGGFLYGGSFIEEKDALEHLGIRNVPYLEEHSLHGAHTLNLILTGLVAALGIGLAYFRYGKGNNVPDPEKSTNIAYKASLNKFYVDEIYDALIVFPFCVLAELLHWGMDMIAIDGIVCGTAEIVRNLSSVLKRIQTGLMNAYAFAILSGTVAFLIYLYMNSVAK